MGKSVVYFSNRSCGLLIWLIDMSDAEILFVLSVCRWPRIAAASFSVEGLA